MGRGDGEVLRCNVEYQTRDGEVCQEGPVKLVLNPLAPMLAAVAEDEKVRRRVGELLVAYYQREAAGAARIGIGHA